MAISKTLARYLKVEVQDTGTPNTWLPIGGLNTVTFSHSAQDTDVTTFDNNGYQSHLIASRGLEIKVDGFYLEDEATGARDPGQERIEELAGMVGAESLGQVRITYKSGKQVQFSATVQIGDMGGGNNDAVKWSASFANSGAPTVTPAPGV